MLLCLYLPSSNRMLVRLVFLLSFFCNSFVVYTLFSVCHSAFFGE